MKDKKQIEEMAKIMQKCYEKNGLLNFKWFAESAYKCLTEDSVVFTKEELSRTIFIRGSRCSGKSYEITLFKDGYEKGSKETAERDFCTIIKALEERKERVKVFYGIAESVGTDIAIKTVKELAKQFGVEVD